MSKFLTSELARLAIFMCKCAKVKKKASPYLYIIHMLVRPDYGPDIRARLLLLGVKNWKK